MIVTHFLCLGFSGHDHIPRSSQWWRQSFSAQVLFGKFLGHVDASVCPPARIGLRCHSELRRTPGVRVSRLAMDRVSEPPFIAAVILILTDPLPGESSTLDLATDPDGPSPDRESPRLRRR